MITYDLKMAEAYVTEVCGGFVKPRVLGGRAVSFYLTETQYVKAQFSFAKFWPAAQDTVRDYTNFLVSIREARLTCACSVRLCEVKAKKIKPGMFPVTYYIELEDTRRA